MSNIVEQISDGLKTIIAAKLGSTWEEIEYTFDIEKNKSRGNAKKYGVHPLEAVSAFGVTRVYTFDQIFDLILTHDYKNRNNDDQQKEKLFLLYDKMDDLLREVYLRKAGVPAIVLNIAPIGMDEPEFLDDDKVIVLRAKITIKYRQSIT